MTWIVVLGYMTLIFLLAMRLSDNSIVDIAYGIGFLVAVAMAHALHPTINGRATLVTVLVTLWAIRLSIQILVTHRMRGGEDFRYRAWRKSWGKWFTLRSFFQIYMLQGTFIVLVALPVLMIILRSRTPLSYLDGIGAFLWAFGFCWESVSDWQKHRFKQKTTNKKRILTSGLWRYSRHPNYFGEIVQWWGVFVIALSVPLWWISFLSPLLITFFLVRVSGVPMLEKKYAGNKEYVRYQKTTNALIPWLPKK